MTIILLIWALGLFVFFIGVFFQLHKLEKQLEDQVQHIEEILIEEYKLNVK